MYLRSDLHIHTGYVGSIRRLLTWSECGHGLAPGSRVYSDLRYWSCLTRPIQDFCLESPDTGLRTLNVWCLILIAKDFLHFFISTCPKSLTRMVRHWCSHVCSIEGHMGSLVWCWRGTLIWHQGSCNNKGETTDGVVISQLWNEKPS